MHKQLAAAMLAASLLISGAALYAQEATAEATPEATPLAEATEASGQPITLVPNTDSSYRIQILVPAGWELMSNGLYMRGSSAEDVALAAAQAVPFDAETVLSVMLPQLGLTEAPESVGEYASDVLTWTLYHVDAPVGEQIVRVRFGLAQQRGTTYILLIQALDSEFDSLYAGVFEQMLDGFVPITVDTSDAPYTSEDVTFTNDEAEITLAGTLTLPPGDGPFTALVLLTGSGPQDRNEHIAGTPMEPFALLADGLTRAGYAVLRYDDRGVGESEGNYDTAAITDFTSDGRAALAWLRQRPEIDPARVGVLGHSEGGIYASILGSEPDAPAFIISMAGTAINGYDLLLLQNRAIIEAAQLPQAYLDMQLDFLNTLFPLLIARDYDAVRPVVEQYVREADPTATIQDMDAYVQQETDVLMQTYANEWMYQLLTIDPAEYWAQTTVPLLGLFGGKDIQVDAVVNAEALAAALETAGNDDVTIVTLPEANHLFQAAETGAVSEYATLPAEFVPDFLPTIIEWLNDHSA